MHHSVANRQSALYRQAQEGRGEAVAFAQGALWPDGGFPDRTTSPTRSLNWRSGDVVPKSFMLNILGQWAGASAFGLATCMLFASPAAAADNFIQLYIAAQGGCSSSGGNPLTYVLVGQDIRSPFGKAAAAWTGDDLASLKAVLAACQVAAARRGNPYTLDEIKRDSDKLLAKIPAIVGQARDQEQAEARQIEARRQLATSRVDKAAQAKEQAKASAEAEVARLESEASLAEAEARSAQTRANARIERANHDRDEAKAKAAAIASLERNAQEDAGMRPRARRAAPGELSELLPEDEAAGRGATSPAPLTATTVIDASACQTIEAVARASQQNAPPENKTHSASSASTECIPVAKGARATIQAAGAGQGLKALCVALEGHLGCLWMAKAAFAAADSQ
jgi:hypothetical protein